MTIRRNNAITSNKYLSHKRPFSRESIYIELAHQHSTFGVEINLETAQKF